MQKIRNLFLFASLAVGSASAPAQLIINEIMQSNIDCIMDDINDFPDSWVELYNAGSESVNLKDFSLGIKNKASSAFHLPDIKVAPGKFSLIYCDKVADGIHTDFRLESGKGCNVYLFKGDEIVDMIEGLKKQPAPNIAYGRTTDAADSWGYQATPTPGKTNCGATCSKVLGDPVFSVPGKVTSQSFDLVLSLPADAPEGTVIKYTTNGKEPLPSSAVYSAPIHISGTKTIRAKLFCDGYLSPRSVTHSYISHPRAVTLPVVSMVTNNDYFYDKNLGIYLEGSYSPGTPNYQYDWRRPVNIEYFEAPETNSRFNQLCETRVKGGATRGNALKSLAVYANKRFGVNRFNCEFFPDQTPGISEFKSFEMRDAGNDFDYMYMRDAVIQQSMGLHADLDWQPSRPAIFYFNGEYKGILNIRPRSNEDYVYSYYDGLEDIDMFENWKELKTGQEGALQQFFDFITPTDRSFADYDDFMDTSEFCNLMIMGTFFDNKDFPGNNIIMWRPQADGGRWRWVAKDTDFGMGLYGERYNYPTLNWVTTPGYDNNRNDWANSADGTRLFRRLINIEEFKNMYIDRCAVYMGDFLTPDSIIAHIDKRYNEIKFEYKYHRDLFNPWWPNYAQEIENARTWTKNRHNYFYTQLASYFGLESAIPLTVDKGIVSDRTLVVNGIPLSGSQFNGKFFPGRTLTLESISDSDDLFINGWEVKVTSGSNTRTTVYHKETLSIEMPAGSSVAIKSILGSTPLAVDAISDSDLEIPTVYYDLSGRRVSNPSRGIYIRKSGSSSEKVIL